MKKLRALLLVFSAACSSEPDPVEQPTSGLDLDALNSAIDPCTDFYEFACGGWIEKNPLKGQNFRAKYFDAYFNAVPKLQKIVTGDAAGMIGADDPDGALIGAYYSSCMRAHVSAVARQDLRRVIDSFLQLATKEEIARQSARMSALGASGFIDFSPVVDPRGSGRWLASIDQGGYQLPDRSYYLDADQETLRTRYKNHIRALSRLIGREIDGEAVLRVETALAEASLPQEERRDPQNLSQVSTASQARALAPNFPWAAHWEGVGIAEPADLNVRVPQFLAAVDQLFATAPLDDLKNYLIWQLLESRARDLDQPVIDLDVEFWSYFTGSISQPEREWVCFVSTVDMLGYSVAQPYLARHFNQGSAKIVESLSAQLGDTFEARLESADWLDENTRAEALDKLAGLTFKIAAPTKWPSYEGVRIDRTSYYDNKTELWRHSAARSAARIEQPIDREEWFLAPLVNTAFYTPAFNDVTIPVLWLDAPFIVTGVPGSRNAGAFGAVIGHEMTHGFDDDGRRFDRSGAVRNWWSGAAEAAFRDRAQCLIDQFQSYEPVPGKNVDGQLTLGENIADLSGLDLAYHAYFDAQPQDAGGDGFDARQIFFLAYAQTFCEVSSTARSEALLRIDPHAPGKLRVNGVVANLPEFSSAFGCSPGDAMVRETQCRIW